MDFLEGIRRHFESNPFAGHSSSQAYVTLSAGLACYPLHGLSANEVIENADRALYQAKRQGRNQVVLAGPKGN